MKKWRVLFFLFFLTVVFTACESSEETPRVVVPTLSVSVESESEADVSTETMVSEGVVATMEPTTPVDARTPIALSTPEAAEEGEVTEGEMTPTSPFQKPGMPNFVTIPTNLPDGCQVLEDVTYWVGDIESGFTSLAFVPSWDDSYHMVLYYIPQNEEYLHYYVRGSGSQFEYSYNNKTYLVIRFNVEGCSVEELEIWAAEQLSFAQEWAEIFDTWLEETSKPGAGQTGTSVPATRSAVTIPCQFDENPNAFILPAEKSGGVNYVVTHPIWGWVRISSDDTSIGIVGSSIVDGCHRLGFVVPENSGPLHLEVTAETGEVLFNHNFFAPHQMFGPEGHSFDGP